jgi:hypothetical protein
MKRKKTGNAFHVLVDDLEGEKHKNFRAQRDVGPALGSSHPRSHSSESFCYFRAQRDLGPALGSSHPRSHSSESFCSCPLCSLVLCFQLL